VVGKNEGREARSVRSHSLTVATGAYSLGWDIIPPRVFIRAILDMFVDIASVCSMSMQNVKRKNKTVITPRANTTAV
jgi:hypothetical protein